MSNILNLLNQRSVALAGLSALATIAAYCVYTRKPWIRQEENGHNRQAGEKSAAESSGKCASSTSSFTTVSTDSGVNLIAGDHTVTMETEDSADATAQELSMVAKMIFSEPAIVAKVCQSVAKDANGNLVDKDEEVLVKEMSESVAIEAVVVVSNNESDAVATDDRLVAMVESEVTSCESTLPNVVVKQPVAKDAASMPAVLPLTPQFVDARLRVLSNVSNSASLILVDGDADILATRLLDLLLGNGESSTVGGSQDLVACLQLIGRHLLAPQRAEVICRNGNLTNALVQAYNSPAAGDVEARIRCLLALASVPISCHGNAASLGAASPETVDRLVGDLGSARLRPHALRVLNHLGVQCRQNLAPHAAALLAHLSRHNSPADGVPSFGLLSGLVASVLSDPASRPRALALPAAVADFPRPASRTLRGEAGMRAAWLDLLAAVAACADELAAVWWATGDAGARMSASLRPVLGQKKKRVEKKGDFGGTTCLAGVIQTQVPRLYKQVKKLADKLKSAEKLCPQGQRLLAIKREMKALKVLAKRKPKVKK